MELIVKNQVASVSIGGGFRKLTDDFKIDIDGVVERIPSGFVWDGASIPRVFWFKYGHPFDDQHEIPGLVHDAIYSGLFGKAYSRKEADEIYRALLRMQGVGWWQATKEYYAVRWFGESHYEPGKIKR